MKDSTAKCTLFQENGPNTFSVEAIEDLVLVEAARELSRLNFVGARHTTGGLQYAGNLAVM
jgi:hypothetical protein